MAVKRLATIQEYVLPAELDSAVEEKRGRYRVRMVDTGLRRQLSSDVANNGWGGLATFQMRQAYYTFAGSTMRWENEDGSEGDLIFPDPIELHDVVKSAAEIEHVRLWTRAWDGLPTPITDWIMKRVYDVNIDWDPDRENPF